MREANGDAQLAAAGAIVFGADNLMLAPDGAARRPQQAEDLSHSGYHEMNS